MYKITIISGYYFPEDTAVGLYNTQMVDYLVDKGYEVNIITGFPNYPQWRIRENYKNKKTFFSEIINKAKVNRYKQYVPSKPTFFKRIFLILDFTFGSFFNLFKIKSCDLVISVVPYTSTILLGWILKQKKNSKLWVHVQDFEFDAAKETGVSSGKNILKNILFKFLFKIENVFLNSSDINSSISYSMIEKLEIKSNNETFYFPNWIDSTNIDPTNFVNHKYMQSSSFKILYSGNIGEKQDWAFFLQFAKRIENYNAEIILVGDGAKRDWIYDKIKDYKNIKFFEPIPYKDLSDLLCSADLHILFQKSNVVDSVMPSKLLGMMASAKPSLITGNSKSEVKIIIDEAKAGIYISDNDLDLCVAKFEELIKFPERSERMGTNARKYVLDKFSAQKVLSNFEKKIFKLVGN